MELVIKELGDFSEISEEVKKLQFCIEFNECIDGLIPDWITHLTFGPWFNQPVDNLPNSTRQGSPDSRSRLRADYTFKIWL